ncbi:phosphodiester glycosidase family protein [Algivirga pacifica]|uniref:Phosphodiester glycosidase domain-containing protein n=1 Tax=Algivirga pacifica TaxID=1162670 RepID=A0ABP9D023_9BACT
MTLRQKVSYLLLFFLVLFISFSESIFQIRSNLYWIFHQKDTTRVQFFDSTYQWQSLDSVKTLQLDTLVSEEGITVSKLHMRRGGNGFFHHMVHTFTQPFIFVVEVDPLLHNFDIYTKKGGIAPFDPSTLKEQEEQLKFFINSNFTDKQSKPMGLILKDGKRINAPIPKWTGFFFITEDNEVLAGPTSIYQAHKVKTAIQAYPSLMKYGKVFSYFYQTKTPVFNGVRITYRNCVGVKKNGNIVFLFSGRGGILNFKEVAILAVKLSMYHATMLDGGKALTAYGEVNGTTFGYSPLNKNWLPDGFAECPSVYIGVK